MSLFDSNGFFAPLPNSKPGNPLAMGRYRVEAQLIGADELRQKLSGLVEKLTDSETRAVFKAAAGAIRDRARVIAPRGKNINYTVLPFGNRQFGKTFSRKKNNLRKAIIAFAARNTKEPTAFARVNVYKGLYAAPHAHLVEFGTRARTAKNGKMLMFANEAGTGWIFAKRVAAMRPQPFFAPAVAQTGQQSLERAADKTAKILQNYIDRH